MGVFKNVNKIYGIVFFHNLIPAYVIERLFWEQRGMTVLMVVICEIIYAVTIVVVEIPTGILADKLGRKTLLVFGAVLSIFEFVILIFATNLFTFAIVVLLAGIASACTSGALNALLYDSLVEVKLEKMFVKIIGRINSIDFICSFLAALSGSGLAKFYGFEFNYFLSAISMFIALGFTVSLKEPRLYGMNEEGNKSTKSHKEYFINAVSFYKTKPKLASFIIHAMAVSACITYLDEFWQLYLDEIGISLLFFGVFSAFISLARIPGNLIASLLTKHFKEESIIIMVLGIITCGFFMSAIFPGMIGLIVIFIVFLASGVVDPITGGYLHYQSSSSIRATIESIQSLIERAITFIVGIGFGIISSNHSVITGFVFLGGVSCLFFVSYISWTRRQRLLLG